MLIVVALILGALIGWQRAGRRGGDRLDRLQYAAAHAIAFGLLGVLATVAIGRFGVS
jgi:hypothetical protein